MDRLRCEHIRKSFDGVVALADVSVVLPGDGIIAIIGPNGAGKTTLLNVVTGFVRPESGRCFLGDCEMTGLAPHWIARRGISRTFQDLRTATLLSVVDNVMLARPDQAGERLWRALLRLGVTREEVNNRERAMELLEFVGLTASAEKPAGELSYGQQKLLTLACCLATEGRILFLDEPVAGVHPSVAQSILGLLERLRDSGKVVVFIEHDIQAVREVADQVIVMDDGAVIAQGPPTEVLERPEIMKAYVG